LALLMPLPFGRESDSKAPRRRVRASWQETYSDTDNMQRIMILVTLG